MTNKESHNLNRDFDNKLGRKHTHTHTHTRTHAHAQTYADTEPGRGSTCQFSGFQQSCREYFCPDEFLCHSIKLVSVNNVQSFSNLIEVLGS